MHQPYNFRFVLNSYFSDRPTDPPTHRPTVPPTHRPTDRPTDRPIDPPTGRPIDRSTGRPADPATDRPSDRPKDQKTKWLEASQPHHRRNSLRRKTFLPFQLNIILCGTNIKVIALILGRSSGFNKVAILMFLCLLFNPLILPPSQALKDSYHC